MDPQVQKSTLVLPPRLTESAQRIREAATARGLTTVHLPTFAVPAELHAEHLHAAAPTAGIAARDLPFVRPVR